MSEHAAPTRVRQTAAPQPGSKSELRLQRKCACGKHTADGSECHACKAKRMSLQRWSADRPSPRAILRAAEQSVDGVDESARRERDVLRVGTAAPTTGEMGWMSSALAETVAGKGAPSQRRGSSAGSTPARLRDVYPPESRLGATRVDDGEEIAAEHADHPSPGAVDAIASSAPSAEAPSSPGSAAPVSGTTAAAAAAFSIPASAFTPAHAAGPRTASPASAEAVEERGQDEEREMEEDAAPAPPRHRLLFDDGVEGAQAGQMSTVEFLARLRVEITAAAEEELAGTGQTTDGCPYLRFWFGYYSGRSSHHLERALQRYAPEAARVDTAADAIPLVVARVRRAVATWARTGEVTGVPSGLPADGYRPLGLTRRRSASSTGNVFGPVQLKAREGGPRAADDPEAVQAELGGGRPLDGGVKTRMERAFGRSFSGVRLHTDATAGRLSSEQNARAFTVGGHVAFAAGEYRPGTPMGDALIAHEMAHVVQQQGGGGASVAPMETGSARYDALERDADQAATGVVASLWGDAKGAAGRMAETAVPALRSGLALQRCSTFSEYSSEEYQGFDSSASPHGLVVPMNADRKVKVRKKEELTFVNNSPSVIDLDTTKPADGITVHGRTHGPATIDAKQGTEVKATLAVSCKHQLSITVDYHYMSDSAKHPHSTKRKPGDETALTTKLNDVWEKQANVHFTAGLVDSPQVTHAMGDTVDADRSDSADWQAVTAFASGAPYNVFFVWEIKDAAGGDTQGATGAVPPRHTLIEDSDCTDHLTLAHEAGHHMGLYTDGTHPSSSVMSSCGGFERQRVTRAEADIVNP